VTTAPNNRKEGRTNVITGVTFASGARSLVVRLRDVSVCGMQLELPNPPKLGSEVTISKGKLRSNGVVVWLKSSRCGIKFNEDIDLDSWLDGRLSRLEQEAKTQSNVKKRIEKISEDFYGEFDDRHSAQCAIRERCAQEMRYVARLVEDLGETFMKEPIILARHARKVQDFDLIKQLITQLSNLVDANDICEAAINIPLSSLRNRILKKSLKTIISF
jgi:hypothetical protein